MTRALAHTTVLFSFPTSACSITLPYAPSQELSFT